MGRAASNELQRMGKEAVMAELDVISRNVLEGTEEHRDGRDVNQLSAD